MKGVLIVSLLSLLRLVVPAMVLLTAGELLRRKHVIARGPRGVR